MAHRTQIGPSLIRLHEAPFGAWYVDTFAGDRAYTLVEPTPTGSPGLVGWSAEVARLIGVAAPDARDLAVLAGNAVPAVARAYAARYGGHQFGHWAGQLGDGRAITLGDLNGFEVQLKGAGPTPYSRRADGRAVLRSSIREFVCSEAMHHLGVPTTRALAVVTTGRDVTRDMFYDGHPRPEPGAICARVAPNFVRLGHFEILAADEDRAGLKKLGDAVTRRDFAEVNEGDYPALFDAVVRRTAQTLARWMTLGFVHGVMNTDNLSVLGLTIDYGPYGWLEEFDPRWTPNTTDLPGRRYAYGRQPAVAEWDLAQFGSALAVIDEGLIPALRRGLDAFASEYAASSEVGFARKLGLDRFADEDDRALFRDLGSLMYDTAADFTLTYRELGDYRGDVTAYLEKCLYRPAGGDERARWGAWLNRFDQRRRREDPAAYARRSREANPRFVPRNYLLQEAIELAEAGDVRRVGELLATFRKPYDEQPGREAFAMRRPEWARSKPGCSSLSCSS